MTDVLAGQPESGWVIEDQRSEVGKPRYWQGHGWGYEHEYAVRFVRKIDAERARAGLDMEDVDPEHHRVCEHIWDVAP